MTDRPLLLDRLRALEELLEELATDPGDVPGDTDRLTAAVGTLREASQTIKRDARDELERLTDAPPAFDLPYAPAADADTMPRFEIDDRSVVMADHIVTRALTTGIGGTIEFPVVLFTFQASAPDGRGGKHLVTMAEVGLIGSPEVLRKAGIVVRDTCNASANRAEGRR
jgi:hypothetical protein